MAGNRFTESFYISEMKEIDAIDISQTVNIKQFFLKKNNDYN